jgi:riboflavin synthase
VFTGLIQTIATIEDRSDHHLAVKLDSNNHHLLAEIQLGDSIAINGVCLTVAEFLADGFRADISPETYKKTNLGDRNLVHVNLEMSLKVGDRLGGHFVSGHVDTVGKVIDISNLQDSWEFEFAVDPTFSKYLIYKGSVAINGISLTIAECENKLDSVQLRVAVIPHTYANTNLKFLQRHDRVNIETDLLGKYVDKIIASRPNNPPSPITKNFLIEHGWA